MSCSYQQSNSNQTGVDMSEQESDVDKWSPCPPATLTALATVLKRRQRGNRIQRIVTIAAAVLIMAAAGRYLVIGTSSQPIGHSYAGISCEDVSQLLPSFISGDVNESQRLKIEAHLELCSSCRGLEQRLRDRQQQKPVASLRLSDELVVTALAQTRH